MALHIAVIYGSVRTDRQGIKAAKFITKKLEEKGHMVKLIDPMAKEYELPFLDKMYKEYEKGKAPENIQRLADMYTKADAFVIVSGEWNHGYPPVLKNNLDHFQAEFHGKPAGIVTYSAGPFGGVRVLTPLRGVLSELGLYTCSISFPISMVQDAFDDEGKALDPKYDKNVEKFIGELEWLGNSLKEARKNGAPF